MMVKNILEREIDISVIKLNIINVFRGKKDIKRYIYF